MGEHLSVNSKILTCFCDFKKNPQVPSFDVGLVCFCLLIINFSLENGTSCLIWFSRPNDLIEKALSSIGDQEAFKKFPSAKLQTKTYILSNVC